MTLFENGTLVKLHPAHRKISGGYGFVVDYWLPGDINNHAKSNKWRKVLNYPFTPYPETKYYLIFGSLYVDKWGSVEVGDYSAVHEENLIRAF